MRSKKLAALLVPVVVLPLALRAPVMGVGSAWPPRRRHALAERHPSDRAKAEIKALLEPEESLADCSTWADEYRR